MLSYRARRRLSLLALVVGLPLYIVVAVNLVDWLNAWRGRPSVPMEFLVYVGLGILWALPLRAVTMTSRAPLKPSGRTCWS